MGEPNPECKWCHGTGEIRLVVTTVPCDCTKECGDCEDEDGCIRLEDDDDDDVSDGGCYYT